MKIIGSTNNGKHLVELSTQEINLIINKDRYTFGCGDEIPIVENLKAIRKFIEKMTLLHIYMDDMVKAREDLRRVCAIVTLTQESPDEA